MRVLRFARNEAIMPGIYSSSEVVSVPQEGEFITLNSIYQWWEIAEAPSFVEPLSDDRDRAHRKKQE